MSFKLYKGKEDDFQIAVAKYLDMRGCLWFHVGNERNAKTFRLKSGKMVSMQGMKLKMKGVKSGVSDVIVLEPRGDFHGLAMELKVHPNKMSEYQDDFLRRAAENNYLAVCCWSIEEAVHIIDGYLNDKNVNMIYNYEKDGKYYYQDGFGLKQEPRHNP